MSVQHLQHLPSDSLDSILSSETPREKFILGELSLQDRAERTDGRLTDHATRDGLFVWMPKCRQLRIQRLGGMSQIAQNKPP
ncbi:hypothetical protein CEXT_541431 [Caerostris extrusa]|uniref:Uncharacterized protein n=1 Tax=Caerostris extrusa TaxID=172846 RepID=A0AAV4XE66_CAEEX|nr:hypothetical protein CEXT_541431 [Caerostris extrusa]